MRMHIHTSHSRPKYKYTEPTKGNARMAILSTVRYTRLSCVQRNGASRDEQPGVERGDA